MDDEFVPISALTHYAYCPRRCALVHIEQIWTENRFTAEGRIMHEHVHDEGSTSRGDVRVERGVSLRSLRLGLIGKADVIEYHKQTDETWQAFPVEYKRGKPKPDHSDKIQLCAQAMCLEEMLNVTITSGALFYGKTRRRLDVSFDEVLRRETTMASQKTHELIASGQTPQPIYAKRCESCSLISECMPEAIQKKRSVDSYIKKILDETS
ncbi:MAG: CRISPR-associated protein Cas4 [Syntrophaceae bacterium]|jgi:CRISPR-associated exonuclease Cas4|nr:CRISPR-associated protein Cas4 [Syntrophaceae bacterium]